MVIRQSTQHDNRQTFTIDVLKNCTTDKNNQKKVFITLCDICTKNKQSIILFFLLLFSLFLLFLPHIESKCFDFNCFNFNDPIINAA